MFRITSTEAGFLLAPTENQRPVPGVAREFGLHPTYSAALEAMVALPLRSLVAAADPGLLPEVWESVEGIVLSEETDEFWVRDFSQCTWTARNPDNMIVPFMLGRDHNTSEWAGLVDEFWNLGTGTTPGAAGRFWANDIGRQARDYMLAGRKIGVSIDGGGADVVEDCDEMDDEGWCIRPRFTFRAVEIMGLTALPFQAFERATIRLRTDEPAVAVAASSGSTGSITTFTTSAVRASTAPEPALLAPVAAPRAWFFEPAPEEGDERLVEQYDERTGEYLGLACPMTITDEGQIYGNLGVKGMCHVGYQHICIPIPTSNCSYEHFMVGYHKTAEGDEVPVGRLTVGANHAGDWDDLLEARTHYEHSGLGWGEARVVDSQWGPWVAGALSPEVNERQLRLLRSLVFSGDWREAADGNLELCGILDVNYPGYPVARRALAASGLGVIPTLNSARARVVDGRPVMLIAGGVQACPECVKRRHLELGTTLLEVHPDGRLDEVLRKLDLVLMRTEGMQEAAARAIVARASR